MKTSFSKFLLQKLNAKHAQEVELIQSLWSGYGKISRVRLSGTKRQTVVVKNILLKPVANHPRGWNTNNSHNRKVKSYEIETHWYKEYSNQCNNSCRLPEFLGAFSEGDQQWIVLEDLNLEFPVRKDFLDLDGVKLCLEWLANFHANFIGKQPNGLWPIGTYWHLATRPDELEKLKNQELKIKASVIGDKLNSCKYQTIVHGDAKLANFCFSEDGSKVAAVDFQYVGGGCGMKDVAYFLGSCLSGEECLVHEEELLDYYFDKLGSALKVSNSLIDFEELEQEWRQLYPFACADFTRFLLGWMPTHQKVNDYNLKILDAVLIEL